MNATLITDDCLEVLRGMQNDSVDLVFCSPPYEDCRTYSIDFSMQGKEWVEWCVEWFSECYRVCRGLTAAVVEGKTRKFQWSATPVLLMAELHNAGIKLRKPPAFCRVGIPGSGGPDWLRNDYEFIVCAAKGKLPWSDNTAMGGEPKYQRGGGATNRTKSGQRASAAEYARPAKTNPGNVVRCTVGGGHMGHELAHSNEAPFPESLADFFIRSFCPPGGLVLDPFSGSGTTCAAAIKAGRRAIGIDIRQSQTDLARRRLDDVLAVA